MDLENARHGSTDPRAFAPAPALAALGVMLLFSAAAHAEPNPYYLGISQAFTHDSNLYRVPDGPGDTFSSTGLVAGIDQPIGRQRLYGTANVRNNRFNKLDQLNNVSYGVNAGLDWETINKLSGTLGVFSNRSLANNSAGIVQPTPTKNLETTDQVLARIQYGTAGLLSLDGAVVWRKLDYSDPAYAGANFDQTSGSAGIRYRPSGALTLGASLRATRGSYSDIQVDYRRNDVDLTAVWVPTGLSTLNARLSYGKQTHEAAPGTVAPLNVEQRDFSGATGFLGWDYKPTGKLSFRTTVSRDTGSETSFLRITEDAPNLIAFGDVSRLTTALSLSTRYEATAKIVANAGVLAQRRTLSDLFLPTPGIADRRGSDRFARVWFGLTWAPTLHWQIGCNVAHEKRTESGGLAVPYTANVGSCSAQYVIR